MKGAKCIALLLMTVAKPLQCFFYSCVFICEFVFIYENSLFLFANLFLFTNTICFCLRIRFYLRRLIKNSSFQTVHAFFLYHISFRFYYEFVFVCEMKKRRKRKLFFNVFVFINSNVILKQIEI